MTVKNDTDYTPTSPNETGFTGAVKTETDFDKNTTYTTSTYNENVVYNASQVYNGAGYGLSRETPKADTAYLASSKVATGYAKP